MRVRLSWLPPSIAIARALITLIAYLWAVLSGIRRQPTNDAFPDRCCVVGQMDVAWCGKRCCVVGQVDVACGSTCDALVRIIVCSLARSRDISHTDAVYSLAASRCTTKHSGVAALKPAARSQR